MLEKLNPFGPAYPATEISALYIYPVKSCRGIRLNSAQLTREGLDLDRKWMFVDAKTHHFQTIRQISEMTLIDTAIINAGANLGDEELVLSIHDTDVKISVPSRPTKQWLEEHTELDRVEIWGRNVDAYFYSAELSKPFCDFLKKDVRLVYKGPERRTFRDTSVNFPDVAPILVASEESLAELNSRLAGKDEDEITYERFRGNIIVRNSPAQGPWSEDRWKTLRIGGLVSGTNVDIVARAARCLVPNVNPDTAVAHKKEPWTTLMSYRRVDPGINFKPCFGMLACPRTGGLLEVGMKVEVTEVMPEGTEHVYGKNFGNKS